MGAAIAMPVERKGLEWPKPSLKSVFTRFGGPLTEKVCALDPAHASIALHTANTGIILGLSAIAYLGLK